MKNALYFALGVVLIVWSFYTVLQRPAPEKYQASQQQTTNNQQLEIAGKTIQVELADTDEERERGLSGRESLQEGTGVLFVFETPGLYGFWMKEMSFPIDIIWLDNDLNIIDIEKNVAPSTFPHVFYPPTPVKYVLETNPGEI